jgi:hypothetical protein
VNGEEPRDGTLTLTSTILPTATRLSMSPSGRIVLIACGGTIDAGAFGADTEGLMLDGLVCSNGSGLTFAASGKTLNFGGKKIYSGTRLTGNVGLTIGPNATNVTIKGGGLQSTKGIEQFEYVKDYVHRTPYLGPLFPRQTADIPTPRWRLIESSSSTTTPDSLVAPGGVVQSRATTST